MGNKINISKEELKKYYIDKELTIKEVSKILGCGVSTIYNLLVKYDLVRSKRVKISKETLYDLYCNKDWTSEAIAEEFNCSVSCVCRRLHRHGIKIKKIELEAFREELYNLYITEEKTTYEIGKMFGFSNVTVGKLLKKYKIKVRKAEDNFKHMRFVGKNNFNYIDGRSPLSETIRKSDNTIRWRKEVFKRANYTCQKCGRRGGDLEAHHNKKPFSVIFSEFLEFYNNFSPVEEREILLRLSSKYKPFWNIDNGITMCRDCHCQIFKSTMKKFKIPGRLKNERII